jgi:predicted nucleic acid-binding protein
VNNVIVVDASVLIAAFSVSDFHHEGGIRILRQGAITRSLVAHPMTIAESAVGAVREGRELDLELAYRALGIRAPISDAQEPYRLARLRVVTRLPLPDCCVIDLAVTTGGMLATFDGRLSSVALDEGVQLVA